MSVSLDDSISGHKLKRIMVNPKQNHEKEQKDRLHLLGMIHQKWDQTSSNLSDPAVD